MVLRLGGWGGGWEVRGERGERGIGGRFGCLVGKEGGGVGDDSRGWLGLSSGVPLEEDGREEAV